MEPAFVPCTAGKLFTIYHPPAEGMKDQGDLIFVPPFAEELNLARHTIARQARAFARSGRGILLVDLYGTGDSEGKFVEARIETWCDDVLSMAAWLAARGRTRLGLWGLRFGALLAMELARRSRFDEVVLWQPVTSGRVYLNQFLRQGAPGIPATDSVDTGHRQGLRAKLLAGEPVNVSGYRLAPELAEAISEREIEPLGHGLESPIYWIEVVEKSNPKLLPASVRVLAKWRHGSVPVTTKTVIDQPFWRLQSLHPVWADNLIAATTHLIAGGRRNL